MDPCIRYRIFPNTCQFSITMPALQTTESIFVCLTYHWLTSVLTLHICFPFELTRSRSRPQTAKPFTVHSTKATGQQRNLRQNSYSQQLTRNISCAEEDSCLWTSCNFTLWEGYNVRIRHISQRYSNVQPQKATCHSDKRTTTNFMSFGSISFSRVDVSQTRNPERSTIIKTMRDSSSFAFHFAVGRVQISCRDHAPKLYTRWNSQTFNFALIVSTNSAPTGTWRHHDAQKIIVYSIRSPAGDTTTIILHISNVYQNQTWLYLHLNAILSWSILLFAQWTFKSCCRQLCIMRSSAILPLIELHCSFDSSRSMLSEHTCHNGPLHCFGFYDPLPYSDCSSVHLSVRHLSRLLKPDRRHFSIIMFDVIEFCVTCTAVPVKRASD